MTRLVVDPNVFVSVLVGPADSAPDLVFQAFLDERVEVVVCPALLSELDRVLGRPKLQARVTDAERREMLRRMRVVATVVPDPRDVVASTRDPKDDYLVALAVRESADAIVTGDRDLLEADFAEPVVWSPREAADRIA